MSLLARAMKGMGVFSSPLFAFSFISFPPTLLSLHSAGKGEEMTGTEIAHSFCATSNRIAKTFGNGTNGMVAIHEVLLDDEQNAARCPCLLSEEWFKPIQEPAVQVLGPRVTYSCLL